MNVLPDSSFLIAALRRERPAVELWEALAAQSSVVHLSPLVLFELRVGFLWRGDRLEEAEFEAIIATMPVVDFTEHVATHAADLQVQMMRKGVPLSAMDAMIAGTAAATRMVLVTGDKTLARVQEAGVPVRSYAA